MASNKEAKGTQGNQSKQGMQTSHSGSEKQSGQRGSQTGKSRQQESQSDRSGKTQREASRFAGLLLLRSSSVSARCLRQF